MRQPEVEDDQVDPLEIRAHARQQFGGALDRQRRMAGPEQRRREAIPDERGVVGDDDRLGDVARQRRLSVSAIRWARCRIYQVLAIIRSPSTRAAATLGIRTGLSAIFEECWSCMATCPECDAEIEVDEFDVDKGDLISCPDCGSNLEVTSVGAR